MAKNMAETMRDQAISNVVDSYTNFISGFKAPPEMPISILDFDTGNDDDIEPIIPEYRRRKEIPDPGPLLHGEFEVNGIRFPISPQGINVYEENQNFKFETLRTRESTKIRSGHAKMSITVSAIFTGNLTGTVESAYTDDLLSINETLMPILYSLKKMPLCFLDNELLRTTLPVMRDEVIGAFVRAVNISTVPGMPYALSAEFQFVWYNHRVFTPRIRFRKEWEDNDTKTVVEFMKLYRGLHSTDPKIRSTKIPGEQPLESDVGRSSFIKNYGHPSIVFNATAHHTWTEKIHEARPLLEFLWPYKYKTTNYAIDVRNLAKESGESIIDSWSAKSLVVMPPFKLTSFNEYFALRFTIMQHPQMVSTATGPKSILQIAQEIAGVAPTAGTGNTIGGVKTMAVVGGTTSVEFISPLGSMPLCVSSGLSPDRNGRPHKGVDLAALEGTQVNSSSDGEIYFIQTVEEWTKLHAAVKRGVRNPRERMGAAVMIAHPSVADWRYTTAYFHLSETLDKRNLHLKIKSGEFIGLSGYTAVDDGPQAAHLHFEIWEGQRGKTGVATRDPLTTMTGYTLDPNYQQWSGAAAGSAPVTLDTRIAAIMDPKDALRVGMETRQPGLEDAPDEDVLKAAKEYVGFSGGPSPPRNEDTTELSALVSAVDEGWVFAQHAITGKVAQMREIIIEAPTFDVIPMNVAIGFGTNLVMTPMEGHRFPTIQYIGGQQTSATISLRAEADAGRAFVRTLNDLQASYEASAISFREFSRRRGIEIINPLINSINMRNVLIETMDTDTIPGAPEGLTVTLTFVDNTVNGDLRPLIMANSETNYGDLSTQALELLFKKGWLRAKSEGVVDTRITTRGVGVGRNDNDAPDLVTSRIEVTTEANPGAPRVAASILKHTADMLSGSKTLNSIATTDVTKARQEALEGAAEFSEPVTAESYIEENGLPYRLKGTYTKGFLRLFLGTKDNAGLISSTSYAVWQGGDAQDLINLLGRPNGNNPPTDPDFAKLYAQIGSSAKFEPGNQSYQDLMLPPNPISGLAIDTNPDFFLVNESDVHLCNTQALEIIFGSEGLVKNPKKIGVKLALAAIDNAQDNFKDIIGLGTGGGLRPANEGRPGEKGVGVYLEDNQGNYRTTYSKNVKTKAKKGTATATHGNNEPIPNTRKDVLPEQLTLSSVGVKGKPAVMTNDIRARADRNKGEYKREPSMDFAYENSRFKQDVIDGFNDKKEEKLGNKLTIQHTFETNTYKENFARFAEKYSSDHYSVRRSFPTFKIFFIEEDGGIDTEEAPDGKMQDIFTRLQGANALDDFYGINAVREISIVQNKEAATSTCVIDILDLDGVLFNRKYDVGSFSGQYADLSGPITMKGQKVVEDRMRDDNNPFFSTVIKEGMKVLVKMGYMNDPGALEVVFVGQIAQFEGNQVVRLVCQGYGSEMVSKRFGSDPSENADLWNSSSSDLIHDLLDREELQHFGRWELKDIKLGGYIFGHEKMRPDGQVKFVRTWKPSVADDNVFIPPVEEYSSTWARLWGDLEYVFWDTTIWDVMKEMELRHPGYVSYPVPYGGGADARMTFFFGHPDMEYISRPPGDTDESKAEFNGGSIDHARLKTLLTRIGNSKTANRSAYPNLQGRADEATALAQGIAILSSFGSSEDDRKAVVNIGLDNKFSQDDITLIEKWRPNDRQAWKRLQELAAAQMEQDKQAALRANQQYVPPDKDHAFERLGVDLVAKQTLIWQSERLKMFRNYEMVTSLHDIVANNIALDHRDTFNSIELHYSDNDVNFGTFGQNEPETLTVNADDNIKEHHIRRTIEAYPNCTTTDLARRYASQLLANSLKRTYKGSLTILGRPKLKPYDLLWVYDNYSDMAGPIEIEEVVHTFSQDTGFLTEIVPNMIVTVREEVTTTMVDAMAKFFTEQIKDYTVGAIAGLGVGSIGTGLFMAGKAMATAGSTVTSIMESSAVRSAKEVFSKLSLKERAAKLAGNVFLESDKVLLDAAVETIKSATAKATLHASRGVRATQIGGGILAVSDAVDDADVSGEEEIRRKQATGFAVGLAASVGFEFFPIAIPVAAVVAGVCLYKYIKYNTTREPIIITPLIKEGKPYVTGIEGMETDGLLCTDLEGVATGQYKKWRYYADGMGQAIDIMKFGATKWWESD